MNSGWIAYRKEEEFLDNIQRFNRKLEREGITGTDKEIMINAYASESASEYGLKAI
jgi:hypothetical protein